MKYLATLSILAAGALPVAADYLLDIDLGVLPLGDTAVAGTTALTIDPGPPVAQIGGRDTTIYHTGVTTPAGNWGNEIVYQFEVTQPSVVSITSLSIGGDADFFLLDGLASSDDGNGKIAADNAIAALFLDGAPPETGQFPTVQPGIYYLAVENFDGFDGGEAPGDTGFDINLTVAPAEAIDFAIDLGPISILGTPLRFDTIGSVIDTELAIFDSTGNLLLDDDNSGGGSNARIDIGAGLGPGTYYAVVAGADTTFGPTGFDITPGAALGDWTFNYSLGRVLDPGQQTGTTDNAFPSNEVQFFVFDIVFPPQSFIGLGTIAMANEPFTIDTLSSGIDTILGVFEGDGSLWALNDDFGGTFQSALEFATGLPAGTWWIALSAWDTFYGDGFFVAPLNPGWAGGAYQMDYPGGPQIGSLAANTPQWFSFDVEPGLEPGTIDITDIDYNAASKEFTVTWDSNLSGPFDIFVGTAAELSALTAAPGNVLPTSAAISVNSPFTFTVPGPLQAEPQLFLQVTE